MQKKEHPIFKRIEDWLTVVDGRKNDYCEAVDDFATEYPKLAGCGCITAIILFFGSVLTIAFVDAVARHAR